MKNINQNINQGKSILLLLGLLAIPLFSANGSWISDAGAHKSHAGKKIVFLKKKETLNALLPSKNKVYRRKQRLGSSQTDWASHLYGVHLKPKTLAFYVRKNPISKEQNGSAIIYKFPYREGFFELAVGLNENNRVKTAAFVSINEEYLLDFEKTVGTGFLDSYNNMSMKDLVINAKARASADEASREFANAIRDAAITLLAFQHK